MQQVAQQLVAGQLNALTVPIWTVMAFVLAIFAGAAAGVWLAGKDLGHELASLMGGLFGPTAAVPAVLLGLIALSYI